MCIYIYVCVRVKSCLFRGMQFLDLMGRSLFLSLTKGLTTISSVLFQPKVRTTLQLFQDSTSRQSCGLLSPTRCGDKGRKTNMHEIGGFTKRVVVCWARCKVMFKDIRPWKQIEPVTWKGENVRKRRKSVDFNHV